MGKEEPVGRTLWSPVGRWWRVVWVRLYVFSPSPFSFFVSKFNYYYDHVLFAWNEFSGISMFASPTDESDEEEEGRVMTREEQELGVICAWMEEGAIWCWMRGKHKGCCM